MKPLAEAALRNLARDDRRCVDVIVLGAGIAGIGLGLRLLRDGSNSFVVLERSDNVGGTWRDNVYPGVACDVPSHLYCLSWLPNPHWSRLFSSGPEIQAYLENCVDREGLRRKIEFGAEMLSAHWSRKDRRWVVNTPKGVFKGRVLVTATGHLADKFLPDLPGLNSFAGQVLHSAAWPRGLRTAGKKIGVVGTGASAIQIVPELAATAQELVIFQRTAPYVIARGDRAYSDAERRMFAADPQLMNSLRADLFWSAEFNFAQRRRVSPFLERARAAALDHLARQVASAELRAKLTPDYELGCKRVLISDNYYPVMNKTNVMLEASALERLDGKRAISADGNVFELDILIFATGFIATRPPFSTRVFGAEGASLDDVWDRGMEAYRSIAVHGFPNLFIVNGPNTGLGNNSVVYVIEAQIDYVMGALAHMRSAALSTLEPTAEAQQAYMAGVRRRSSQTVWLTGGCKSWYVDARSSLLTLVWPDHAHAFRDENGTFEPRGYACAGLEETLAD
jgi:cation diffusion facilitator CzcD-associated flavoprotein CzcO